MLQKVKLVFAHDRASGASQLPVDGRPPEVYLIPKQIYCLAGQGSSPPSLLPITLSHTSLKKETTNICYASWVSNHFCPAPPEKGSVTIIHGEITQFTDLALHLSPSPESHEDLRLGTPCPRSGPSQLGAAILSWPALVSSLSTRACWQSTPHWTAEELMKGFSNTGQASSSGTFEAVMRHFMIQGN